MPHLILETSADLAENARVGEILEVLVTTISGFSGIQSSAVKAYHNEHKTWRMGEKAAPGFAHLTFCLLSGRTADARRAMAHGLFNKLKEGFAESLESGKVQISLEVREMDVETYRR